jgi:hypothetical protein
VRVGGLPDERIAALGRLQWGRVSRRQLLVAGLSSGMVSVRVARGQLLPRHRGVYAVGHLAGVEHGREAAALLAGGSLAVLSHRSAAAQ